MISSPPHYLLGATSLFRSKGILRLDSKKVAVRRTSVVLEDHSMDRKELEHHVFIALPGLLSMSLDVHSPMSNLGNKECQPHR